MQELIINILFISLIIGSNKKAHSYFDCPCPHIIAHQGASLDLPPNTIEAFQLALDHGADIIELDIWRSMDGVWVVIHDGNLLRIAGVNKDITQIPFKEIQSLDAAYNFSDSSGNYLYRDRGYKIPSLEEVFKNFKNEKMDLENIINDKNSDDEMINLAKRELSELDKQNQINEKLKLTYENLNSWQKTQVARHEDRPKANFYIKKIFSEFTLLSGDRYFGDDKSVIAGFGLIDNKSVLVIGQEKGEDLDTRIERNFGMMRPEGYRKSIRLMKIANKFNSKPCIRNWRPSRSWNC